PLEVARQKTQEKLPARGTALLCAAGPRDPAKAPPKLRYTMFSSVLLDILKDGAPEYPARMSLTQIGDRAKALIVQRFPDEAVRPQVHSPDQGDGDIAGHPLFPNPRLGTRGIVEALAEIHNHVSTFILDAGLARTWREFAHKLKMIQDGRRVSIEGSKAALRAYLDGIAQTRSRLFVTSFLHSKFWGNPLSVDIMRANSELTA